MEKKNILNFIKEEFTRYKKLAPFKEHGQVLSSSIDFPIKDINKTTLEFASNILLQSFYTKTKGENIFYSFDFYMDDFALESDRISIYVIAKCNKI